MTFFLLNSHLTILNPRFFLFVQTIRSQIFIDYFKQSKRLLPFKYLEL